MGPFASVVLSATMVGTPRMRHAGGPFPVFSFWEPGQPPAASGGVNNAARLSPWPGFERAAQGPLGARE